MVDYTTIHNTLSLLDSEYGRAVGMDLPLLFSKLAVIEFCGWIEESFDRLCKDYVSSWIVDSQNKTKIESIIKKNHGFHYDSNVFPLMCSVFGINNWENIIDGFQGVKNHLETIMWQLEDQSKCRQKLTDDDIIQTNKEKKNN